MFRGRFFHTLDTKGRVSVPRAFRTELERRSDRPPILTNMRECLALYPADDWAELEQRLLRVDPLMLEGQDLSRFMISGATECAPDSQGRILIPEYLRDHAGIVKEVAIAGVGPRIELWDKARFDEQHARTLARFPEISAEVSRNGAG